MPSSLKYWRADFVPPKFTEDEIPLESSEEELTCEALSSPFSLEDDEQLAAIKNSKNNNGKLNFNLRFNYY
uniref:Uncharacterized protein n=1 Tax=uncultured bacterium contig00052 TaxID=1181536 RepID=A0A806KGU6_9BACT|nr:hypothetical protein [uncultured bacterium contig00052]